MRGWKDRIEYKERGVKNGAAARAQTRRKSKVPLTLAPHPWAPVPVDELPPEPPKPPPRKPGPKWDRAVR